MRKELALYTCMSNKTNHCWVAMLRWGVECCWTLSSCKTQCVRIDRHRMSRCIKEGQFTFLYKLKIVSYLGIIFDAYFSGAEFCSRDWIHFQTQQKYMVWKKRTFQAHFQVFELEMHLKPGFRRQNSITRIRSLPKHFTEFCNHRVILRWLYGCKKLHVRSSAPWHHRSLTFLYLG